MGNLEFRPHEVEGGGGPEDLGAVRAMGGVRQSHGIVLPLRYIGRLNAPSHRVLPDALFGRVQV